MYCPLQLHFCSKSSQNKIEKIQYRSLKLITNNYNKDYKFLLNETRNSTMKIKRMRTLTLESSLRIFLKKARQLKSMLEICKF